LALKERGYRSGYVAYTGVFVSDTFTPPAMSRQPQVGSVT
jgi:hypothetical protein